MKDPLLLEGPRLPPAEGAARQLVVFLHGYGADGNDLIGIGAGWARDLPHAAFFSPHAPEPFPFGRYGRQWYALGSSVDRTAEDRLRDLRDGVGAASEALNRTFDLELERLGLRNGALALVGFSQGAAVALHVGLRRPAHAVVALSGPLGDLPLAMPTPVPQVFLAHGDQDNVVPVAATIAGQAALKAARVPVQTHIARGYGHGIDPETATLAVAFLRAAFTPAS